MSDSADSGRTLDKKHCRLKGTVTVWAESRDERGQLVGNDDWGFDESVKSGRRLDLDSTMVVNAIGWDNADTFLSQRNGHGSDNYRCRAIRVEYPFGIKVEGEVTDEWVNALLTDIACMSNWSLIGFVPVGFRLSVKDERGREFHGGDDGPVAGRKEGGFR